MNPKGLIMRIIAAGLCLILAGAALFSACGARVFAQDGDWLHTFLVDEATRYDTPEKEWTGENILPNTDNITIRVGLLYKYSSINTLAFSQTISAAKGLTFFTEIDGVKYPLGVVEKSASVVRNKAAALDASGNYVSSSKPTFLPYSLITKRSFSPFVIERAIRDVSDAFGGTVDVYTIADDQALYVGVGQYATAADATAAIETLQKDTPFTYEVFVGDETTLAVVSQGRVITKVVTGQNLLNAYPVQPDYSTVQVYYTQVLLGNAYPGVFEYAATDTGMSLTNVVDFEEYIKCVVPSEVFNTWPEECLKGFSIAVRSYSLDKIISSNHAAQGFHICPTTHCQVYKGRLKATVATDRAVEVTRGMVLSCKNKLVVAYYSSSHGGVSESAKNVWGSDPVKYSYLSPVYMPQETYDQISGATWSSTYTATQMSDLLLDSSRVTSTLGTKKITKVEVLSYTESGYVYKVRLTNSAGKTYTYSQCSNIRSVFSVKSANFKLANPTTLRMPGGNQVWSVNGKLYYSYLNVNSIAMLSHVPEGTFSENQVSGYQVDNSTYGIFGQGYGHGIGMSQYCARDLANLGWQYEEIATFFYPGSKIADMEEFFS
ncbi:MAG TPA: hypothetical protein DCY74_05660 [Clostridiales bacterium]|nr:hypothetical protein [Clostridiales bacterium]HCG36396.1 hypothetical protein [Clostridiales bacterium]